MAYYTQVLQPGETVKHIGQLHWILHRWEILTGALTVIAALLHFSTRHDTGPGPIYYVMLLLLAATIVLFIRSWVIRATTEIVVTDRRIIHKVGLISRHTQEINITKVETVDVNQSLWGRMVDYGSVSIIGTGGSWEPLRHIASPLQLRNAIVAG